MSQVQELILIRYVIISSYILLSKTMEMNLSKHNNYRFYPAQEVLGVVKNIKRLYREKNNITITSSQVIELAVQFVVEREMSTGYAIDWNEIWSRWGQNWAEWLSCDLVLSDKRTEDPERRAQMLVVLPEETYKHLKALQKQIKLARDGERPGSRSYAYVPYTVRMVCRTYLWYLLEGADAIPTSTLPLVNGAFTSKEDETSEENNSPTTTPEQIKTAIRNIYGLIYKAHPDIDTEKAEELFNKIVESASVLSQR